MTVTAGPRSSSHRRGGFAAHFVVRAAVAAPSVHNTQPWFFVSRQGVIRLHADPGRKLSCADPAGREMMISCGAALFNLRLAMRHLGFAPTVRLFPDLSQPDLLAEVQWGRYKPPTAAEESLYKSITMRHTYRGPFAAGVPPLVVADLVSAVRKERANLHVIYDIGQHQPLAELIRAADVAQSGPRFAAEAARWTLQPWQRRRDGVPACACPQQPDGLEFSTRCFGGASGYGFPVRPRPDDPRAMGVVALLSTRDDRRAGWIFAGQALQRLLLQATAQGVRAAFHTQPLELSGTRERIRAEFTNGAYPQMLLRLGCADRTVSSPRRAVTETLRYAS